jgi:amidohydrolase
VRVVGVIHGRHAGNRTLGFRADMDALPIEEGTGLPHASTHPGAMHACGHDGHTAILLGSAFELARTRNFSGSVVLLFQPAEEGGGGAQAMVADGVMERWGIDEVYGLHNLPGLPSAASPSAAARCWRPPTSSTCRFAAKGRTGRCRTPVSTRRWRPRRW